MERRPGLDALVTNVATALVGVDASTATEAYHHVVREVVHHFGARAGYLHHGDSDGRHRTVAEWPARSPGTTSAWDADVASVAAVPVVVRNRRAGVLGVVAPSHRRWTRTDHAALETIATLFAQVQARLLAEDQLRRAATHDALTGLLNRRGVSDALAVALSGTASMAVLYVDLDRLEALNDALGHSVGDAYLRTVADRLRHAVNPDFAVGRWGGDEFVVILPGPITDDDAYAEAARILTVVTERVEMSGEFVSRTASIGVAPARPGVDTVDSAVGNADKAALAAKLLGGNAVSLFTAEIRERSELRNDIELHLRGAIANHDLLLHYQPEIDLTTDRITAVEALVRWQHPTRGMLPPVEFVAIAEVVNLAADLGRWVLDDACRTFARWRREIETLDITLRVNVSPAQLLSRDFVRTVDEILTRYRVPARSLCIEITEVAVLHDISLAAQSLDALRALGVTVAIDDFGTGYSSLSHLSNLPVDAVKIDREFVEHLESSEMDRAIVRAVGELARAYSLEVIAEGLETVGARDVLLELGCTRAQGYLYARPHPAAAVLDMLREGTIVPTR